VFQLIVFDLDGTLVDSRTDLANATNALIEELGGERLSDQVVADMIGEGAGVLVRRALKAAGRRGIEPADLDRFLALYDAGLLEHTRPYDGMTDTLDRIAASPVPMSVLTNKPAHATERLLEGLGLRRYFRDVIGGDTAHGRKPDPAGLMHLVNAAGATPSSTVLVGDSRIDLETARSGGVRICLARYGFGYRFSPEDFAGDELFIDRPQDLLDVL
jgi:phosphoglycolate phosphatase